MADPAAGPDGAQWARTYIEHGWSLVLMEHGSKGPKTPGWNAPSEVVDTVEKLEARLARYPDGRFNMGLIHAPSGTVAIDVDDLTLARSILAELGVDLDAVLAGGWRIISPKANRAKVLFAAPDGAQLDRKTITWPRREGVGKIPIIDFRGGLNQDVLPPSAHPDGGFYAWAPEVGGAQALPPLPADLESFWRACDDPAFRKTLDEMCPWAPQAATPMAMRRRNVSGEGANTIGKFNELHTVEEMLQRGGYKRRGKKWLHPSSQSGMPGVTVKDGKMFSHHDSDPLCDGYWHDPFDLYVVENYGDFVRALESAGQEVGFHVERPPVDADTLASVEAILASAERKRQGGAGKVAIAAPEPVQTAPQAPLVLPESMTKVGGFVGAVTEWILETAPRPNPVLAHVAAVSLAGLMLGRKVATDTGLRTNQLLVSVARTGAGKDHPRKAIAKIASSCGANGGLEATLFGPDDIASGSGFLSLLHSKPNVLCQLDEFGLMLKKWLAPRAAAHEADIQRQMLAATSKANGTLYGAAQADVRLNAPKVTPYPCFHLHGTTTPDVFFEALTGTQVSNGFLNRMLVYFTSEAALTPLRHVPFTDPPAWLTQWCIAARDMTGSSPMIGLTPDNPVILRSDPDAQRLRGNFEIECLDYSNRGDEIWQRAGEHVMRLAMVYACSQFTGDELRARAASGRLWIDAVSMQRAIDEVRLVIVAMSIKTGMHVSDNEFDRLCKSIEHAVEKCGERGATKRDLYHLSRPYRAAEDRVSRGALAKLQDGGRIKEVTIDHGGAGRPRRAYVSARDDPD